MRASSTFRSSAEQSRKRCIEGRLFFSSFSFSSAGGIPNRFLLSSNAFALSFVFFSVVAFSAVLFFAIAFSTGFELALSLLASKGIPKRLQRASNAERLVSTAGATGATGTTGTTGTTGATGAGEASDDDAFTDEEASITAGSTTTFCSLTGLTVGCVSCAFVSNSLAGGDKTVVLVSSFVSGCVGATRLLYPLDTPYCPPLRFPPWFPLAFHLSLAAAFSFPRDAERGAQSNLPSFPREITPIPSTSFEAHRFASVR